MNATSLRIDHNLSSNWFLFGRYNDAPSQTLSRPGVFATPSTTAQTRTPTKTTTVGLRTLVTPQLTNSLHANYSIQHSNVLYNVDSLGGAVPPDSTILFPPPLSPEHSFVFFQTQGGYFQTGPSPDVHESQANLTDDIAFAHRAHQMKFGIDWRRLDFSYGSFPQSLSSFAFSLQNFSQTGTLNFISTGVGAGAKMRFHNLSLYGQDAWRIGARLTLTYGLRWEFDPTPSGLDGTKLASWQNVENPAAMSLAPFGTPVWKTTYGHFAPRLGATYKIGGRENFVVRGGWGLFYDLGSSSVSTLAAQFPNTAARFVPGPIQLPLTSVAPYAPAISLNPSSSSQLVGFAPNLQLPRSYQWNVALERSFGSTQALSVTYLGQVGRELLRREDILPPSSNSTFSRGSLFFLTRNGDTSDYDALQVQYRKALSRGVQALLSYTWSHSIDTGSDDSLDLNSHLIISGANDRGNSSFDVRHNFSGAIIYDLPRVSRQPFLSALTRNWSFNVVAEARSGFPFDVETSSVAIPGLTHGTRADLVPGQPIWLSGPYPGGRKLNFGAFAVPLQPRQGTLGRNAIIGFGMTQVDLSVARKFSLTEKVSLQFRSDFFNVFNNPNFANPIPCLDCGPASFGLATRMLNQGLTASLGSGLNSLYQVGGPRSVQLSTKIQF